MVVNRWIVVNTPYVFWIRELGNMNR